MKRVVFAILVLGAIGACSQHDDLPPMLSVVTSPTPGNFTVTTPDDITFTLRWTISDPTSVAFYNLYTQDPFTGLDTFIDSTTTTTAQVTTQIAIPGLVFGVASVSVGNIESALAKASATP